MMMGGRRLVMLREESRLGDESREDGLEERECGEMGLMRAPLAQSSEVMIRDRAETEADLGTLLPEDTLCFSGVFFGLPSLRPSPGSRALGVEFLVPVLLLRRRMRLRLKISADNAEDFAAPPAPASGSPSTNIGLSAFTEPGQGLSSSEENANFGMVSRLKVLVRVAGLQLRSCREE